MDKEQILALAEEQGAVANLKQHFNMFGDSIVFTLEELEAFFNAAIESYKAELLKEVGKPVAEFKRHPFGDYTELSFSAGYSARRGDKLYTSDQVAAAILKATKPLEERLSWLDYTEKMNKALVVEIEELHAQLAAAQEEGATVTSERDNLWFKLETAKAELADLRDQLAKAEQRVAEACALVANNLSTKPWEHCETSSHAVDIAAFSITKLIRSGEWRKFVKEN